jgi:hypothetical protein
MADGIPRYELDVLRWHKDGPQKPCGNADRKAAQVWLAMNGYLVEKEDEGFSIITRGLRVLANCK